MDRGAWWATVCGVTKSRTQLSDSAQHSTCSSCLFIILIPNADTQWPCCVGPPKTGGSWWRDLTECGPLEKGMANHFSMLALKIPWTVWKGKMIGYRKRNSLGQYVPNMLLEISGEITPERMKGWSQSKNNIQLWMWLVIEARSDAVKSNIA